MDKRGRECAYAMRLLSSLDTITPEGWQAEGDSVLSRRDMKLKFVAVVEHPSSRVSELLASLVCVCLLRKQENEWFVRKAG